MTDWTVNSFANSPTRCETSGRRGIVVLATAADSNVAIISAVTKDLTSKVHAGKLVGSVASAVGGKGGGRPDMAEAGGSKPEALAAALEQVYTTVEGML